MVIAAEVCALGVLGLAKSTAERLPIDREWLGIMCEVVVPVEFWALFQPSQGNNECGRTIDGAVWAVLQAVE